MLHWNASLVAPGPDDEYDDYDLYPDDAYTVIEASGRRGIPGGLTGRARTTRYWDCAKPSCGWWGKAAFNQPARSCAQDGVTAVSMDATSGADGGWAYTCNNYAPWVVRPRLAFGYAAFRSTAGEARSCCACFELKFTTTSIAGKRMIVQAINTGVDVDLDGHFDIQMPGGGIGLVNACAKQWNAGPSWGAQYGGLASNTCWALPQQLQEGCRWRFDWFEGADNPEATFKEVTCPRKLARRSGCVRNDSPLRRVG